MNILILTHLYPDAENRWRGSFVREQALALSKENEVMVLFIKVDYSHFSPFGSYKFKKSITGRLTEYELVVFRSFPVITQAKYFLDTWRFFKKEILSNVPPDIINSHLSYPAGFFGTIIQKLTGIPHVVTEHSWIKKHFRSSVHKMSIGYALKNSAGVVAVSNALREDLIKFYKRRITVIPNVIDIGKFQLVRKTPGGVFNIGILGGLSNYRKGLDILIDAVSLVRNRDIVVHIGGAGTLMEKFINQAKEKGIFEKCRFYGNVPPVDLQKFYARLDTFILASRDETFGVVLVEAMACGIPVIATDCGGPKEIMTDYTGIIIDKENPGQLAEAIIHMSENLQRYDREKIRNYALANYGYEAFISKSTEYYNDLLRDQKSGLRRSAK